LESACAKPNLTPEIKVTEIILAKVSRLCQLSSHSRGFFSRLQIFRSIGPSLWIFFGGGGGGAPLIFDKTVFAKFRIRNNLKQNIDEILPKQLKIYTSVWILKSQEKNARLLPNVCDFQKDNHTPGYGFKNL
jgi:hypothetical protein